MTVPGIDLFERAVSVKNCVSISSAVARRSASRPCSSFPEDRSADKPISLSPFKLSVYPQEELCHRTGAILGPCPIAPSQRPLDSGFATSLLRPSRSFLSGGCCACTYSDAACLKRDEGACNL